MCVKSMHAPKGTPEGKQSRDIEPWGWTIWLDNLKVFQKLRSSKLSALPIWQFSAIVSTRHLCMGNRLIPPRNVLVTTRLLEHCLSFRKFTSRPSDGEGIPMNSNMHGRPCIVLVVSPRKAGDALTTLELSVPIGLPSGTFISNGDITNLTSHGDLVLFNVQAVAASY